MKRTFNPNNHRLEELGLWVTPEHFTEGGARFIVLARPRSTLLRAEIYTIPAEGHRVTKLVSYPLCRKGQIRPIHTPILKLRYYLATGRIPSDITWEVMLAQARQVKNELGLMNKLINKAGAP